MLAVTALLGAEDVQTLEALGEAPLSMGYVQAVQRAKDMALRNVVQQACKRLASSDPNIAQCAIADDRLYAGFSGLVSKLEVLSEEKTDDAVTVKVRAAISLKAVSAEELEAQRLYQRLGGLRLSLGVTEVIEDGRRPRQAWAGQVGMRLGDFFKADGWRLYALAGGDQADLAAVQRAAKADGTDYALVGTLLADRLGDEARVTGRLKLIELVAGRVVGDVDVRSTEKFEGRPLDRAALAIVEREASGWARALRTGLVRALRESESKGVEVAMIVEGVKTEAKAQEIVQKLQTVSGVLEVEGGLDGTRLELKVRSTGPAKELARTVAKAMSDKLSITGVKAAAIEGVAK